jgi:hypothetical protein
MRALRGPRPALLSGRVELWNQAGHPEGFTFIRRLADLVAHRRFCIAFAIVLACAMAGCSTPARPAAARSDCVDAGAPLSIDAHRATLEAGTSFTLKARGGDCSTYTWTLLVNRPGSQPQPVRNATARDFALDLDTAGSYLVTLGDAGRNETQTSLSVGFHRTGDGRCKLIPPSSPEPPTDTCEGLAFDVPAGMFWVNVTAAFPSEQAVLPCPYLALYDDGEAVFENYWWSLEGWSSPASISEPSLSSNTEHMEVRWVPTMTKGGEALVTYTVSVEPVLGGGAGGAGGNGC